MSLIVQAHVAQAAHTVVAGWPVSSFIAVNPLAAFEKTRFEEVSEPGVHLTLPLTQYRAAYTSGRITRADLEAALRERIPELAAFPPIPLGGSSFPAEAILVTDLLTPGSAENTAPTPGPGVDPLEGHLTKWIAGFVDPHPLWPMPARHEGFYPAWKASAGSDPTLPRAARHRIRTLPTQPLPALTRTLGLLGVADGDVVDTLRTELAALPGWTAHIKWRAEHVGDIDLTSYLAVRLALRHALNIPLDPPGSSPAWSPGKPDPALWERATQVWESLAETPATNEQRASIARVLMLHPPHAHPFTWQHAYERHYRARLLASITPHRQLEERPATQVVMCIDPRSEGVRRHLELDPSIETYGFAGFFGVPIRFASYQARGSIDSLPALLSPRHAVTETPTDPGAILRRQRGLRRADAAQQALHATDSGTGTPFALAETAGWFYGAATAARTLFPGATGILGQKWRALVAPPAATEVTVADTFTLPERVGLAEAAVRMMGLNRFAPLVVLAGHGSTSTNNLYQSALDCGACGGNPGAVNARAAAAIFNDPTVRAGLNARGIHIPPDTHFLAAVHDTVADTITPLDTQLIPATHRPSATAFVQAQQAAADRLVRERAATLPGATPRQRLSRLRARAHDWAEVYPELGLAGNAAMIIGPREITAGVNLHRRVFLHSYRPELDPNGNALETILTAPVVVAQWINHQYYFSTLNPDTLGAGTKTIHNAVGTIGVLSGHRGDLRRGLPTQSVAVGDTLLHEPLRLAVVAQAPLERIEQIISGNQVLRDLFDNDWITLTARPTPDTPWYRYATYGWALLPDPIKPHTETER